MTLTTKEMITVMQAFEDGKLIEAKRRNNPYSRWQPMSTPVWNWQTVEYRIALTKPSCDWSHVSNKINFLIRQSPVFGGSVLGLSHRPVKEVSVWRTKGRVYDIECLASYDSGTCGWQDSLVVRPGYKGEDA